jgi:hypothetical protein
MVLKKGMASSLFAACSIRYLVWRANFYMDDSKPFFSRLAAIHNFRNVPLFGLISATSPYFPIPIL